MKKLKCVEVRNEPFESYGFVFFDCTPKEAAAYVRKNLKGVDNFVSEDLEKSDEAPPEGVCISGGGNFVIWLSANPQKTDRGRYLLSHEATHATLAIMRHWSIPVVKETGEVAAILTGFIMKKTLEKPKKR